MLSSPLRPEGFRLVAYEDATPLLADVAALRRKADELGYLYFRKRVPAALIDPVRAFVRDYCLGHGWVEPAEGNPPRLLATRDARLEGRGWDDARFVELQRQLRLLAPFQALGHSEAVQRTLELLCGHRVWMATANYCWIKFPGSPAQTTRPHQDRFYLPDCPTLWTAWVPLVDTPLELGPLGVVPGSHRLGRWPHLDALTGIDVAADVCWATGAVEAGDLVLFGTDTVHCAWSNVSPQLVRLALDIRYEERPAAGGTTILRPLS